MLVAATVVVLVALASHASGAASPTLADCDARVARAPDDPGSYYCYVIAAQVTGRFDDAIRRLEAILALRPDLHRARLDIAVIEHDLGRPSAIDHYLDAIEGMEATNDAWGLIYGHSGLGAFLDGVGRADESGPHYDRALAVAEEVGDPLMLAHAWARAANHADGRLDHGTALRLYRRAEAVVFPDGPPYLQSWVLSGLGRVYWALGERQRALAVYQREVAHLRALGNRFSEAMALYNITVINSQLADEGQIDPARIPPLAERALQVAIDSGNRTTEGTTRALLSTYLHGQASVEEARRALRVLEQAGSLEQVLQARRNLAMAIFHLGPEHHAEANAMVDEAIEQARRVGDRFSVTRGLVARASHRMLSDAPHEETVAAFLEAIEAVEGIRELQSEQGIRARSFGQWAFLYARLAGYLLRGLPSAAMPEDDLALAFRTLEQMRARVLLDLLESAGAVEPGRSGPVGLVRPDVPRLREVQERLGPRQALLAYHLHSDGMDRGRESRDYSGSWLISITRDTAQAFPVPERKTMQQRIPVYRGTLPARDGSEAVPAVRLYDDLLREAIDALPPEVDRLTIVPDGVLHELPFGTLRDRAGAPPLAARFRIDYSPSATLWARARRRYAGAAPNAAVLALADPDLGVDADSRLREAGRGFDGLGMARLPHAVGEARSLRRRLGGQGKVLEGDQATEAAVKQADLAEYGVLHFAAHAVVDRTRPERSAVVLAPGAGSGEDGLLHMREIAELDLDGRLVILSACRSASGELIDGEGMVGLSRAFFAAGARTVVGSLWPLRDDEAATLVEDLSDGLGSGKSVAAALAETRRGRIAAGAPAAEWAGLVVLGDGDLVLTEGRGRLAGWLPALGAALALLGLLAALFLRGSGRSLR